jgi:hypothetical protein
VAHPERTLLDGYLEGAVFLQRAIANGAGDLRPALDVETDAGFAPDELAKWCLAWAGVVSPALGRCLLYANRSVVRHLGRARLPFIDALVTCFDLWLAADDPSVPSPSPWRAPVLWQSPARHLDWTREEIDVDRAANGIGPLLRSFT